MPWGPCRLDVETRGTSLALGCPTTSCVWRRFPERTSPYRRSSWSTPRRPWARWNGPRTCRSTSSRRSTRPPLQRRDSPRVPESTRECPRVPEARLADGPLWSAAPDERHEVEGGVDVLVLKPLRLLHGEGESSRSPEIARDHPRSPEITPAWRGSARGSRARRRRAPRRRTSQSARAAAPTASASGRCSPSR